MPTKVLICDDSSLARNMLARSLPADWDIDIQFATNGKEGLAAIEAGHGEIVFLDLTMPELDGYGVLEYLHERKITPKVVVVSSDIQPDAQDKVLKLGALAFVKKPMNSDTALKLVKDLNFYTESSVQRQRPMVSVNQRDCYQEIANVAMGQAANQLARMLDAFIILPIPKVDLINANDLRMTITQTLGYSSYSAICQGFSGSGIAGEAIVFFNDMSFSELGTLLNYKDTHKENIQLEILMDIGSLLIGTCIQGIGNQIDIHFNQSQPVILGQHSKPDELLNPETMYWEKTLAIDIHYTIEHLSVDCNLLLLFTEDSIAKLNKKIDFLLG